MDVLTLTQALISYPSLTPTSAGSLDFISTFLEKIGFSCHRFNHQDVDNLYARFGTEAPNFCFAGHVDVVPPGELKNWKFPPFSGTRQDDFIYGRGSVDMKGAIAAFMIATQRFVETTPFTGSLSFLLTSDEEGPALYGTKYALQQLNHKGEFLQACLVGEPTSSVHVGDTVKIGRRGSVNFSLTEKGTGGHVAYPTLADNPIPRFLDCLSSLISQQLDEGTTNFIPSVLQVVSVDVGNSTFNMIPPHISALLNCRFNNLHTADSLIQWMQNHVADFLKNYTLKTTISGEAFLCHDDHLKQVVQKAIVTCTGAPPSFSTSGGTSDARFIKDYCPVIEVGLLNKTAHHVNEYTSKTDLLSLEKIYTHCLLNFFGKNF